MPHFSLLFVLEINNIFSVRVIILLFLKKSSPSIEKLRSTVKNKIPNPNDQ
jgi:hypothetical protein